MKTYERAYKRNTKNDRHLSHTFLLYHKISIFHSSFFSTKLLIKYPPYKCVFNTRRKYKSQFLINDTKLKISSISYFN